MQVDPGELNKRIQIIKESSEERDEDGFPVKREIIIRKCWAKFSRDSGTEQARSGSDFVEIKCRFLIRHTKTKINEGMKVKYGNDIYEVKYVNDYGDEHRYDEIWCERVM